MDWVNKLKCRALIPAAKSECNSAYNHSPIHVNYNHFKYSQDYLGFNILPRDPENENWDTALLWVILPSEGAEAVGQRDFVTSQAPGEREPWVQPLVRACGWKMHVSLLQELIPGEGDRGCQQTHSTFIFNLECLSQEILPALKQT